ncbi:beta-ketoacyl reductase [Aspergillus undulatus]|uniref:beta-ketoacyl reductase n=1 Tax=Aspergillus undulatus TaxID=1810928 RepID=UPI003CCCCA33
MHTSARNDVARAVEGTRAPLKGIIQMSMVLRDQMFHGMSLEDWHAVLRPKVQGTWNLHAATLARNINLDLFILFSSLSGIVGQTSQANYAAANTFLDSFAQYRNQLGLACTAIDLGAMDGVGYLSENQDLLRKMQGTGWRVVQEGELLEGLELAMMGSSPSSKDHAFLLGISPTVPLSSPDSDVRLRRDMRMAVHHNVGSRNSKAGSANDGLRAFLKSVQSNPNVLNAPDSVTFLATEIGKKLYSLLLKSEDEAVRTMEKTFAAWVKPLNTCVVIFIRRPGRLGAADSHGHLWYCYDCESKNFK